MNLDIVTVSILLGYLYTMVFVLKLNDHVEMALLTAVVILYLYIRNRNSRIEGYRLNAETYAPAGGCSGDTCTKGEVKAVPQEIQEKETKEPSQSGTPQKLHTPQSDQSGLMSNYDGLCLKTGNQDPWMKSPSNLPLSPTNGLYTLFGSTAPTNPVFSDNSALHGPPVDGQPGSPQSMFMLGYNKVSPECCPSTFSTSTGCVCSTQDQRTYVKNRGNNSTGCPTIV